MRDLLTRLALFFMRWVDWRGGGGGGGGGHSNLTGVPLIHHAGSVRTPLQVSCCSWCVSVGGSKGGEAGGVGGWEGEEEGRGGERMKRRKDTMAEIMRLRGKQGRPGEEETVWN